MKLNDKNILLISPESWNHISVSKHHYAIYLGQRKNKVYFLNPPTNKKEVLVTGYSNVWQVNYTGFPNGLRYYPTILQKHFIRKKFEQLQILCGVDFDLVWSFDNSVFFDFSALPKSIIKISHIVDLNQDFQTRMAAETATVCFGVCLPIVEKLSFYNKDTYFVNHGCLQINREKKVTLPGENKIKAVYAGNLNSRYLDWTLFKKIVTENIGFDFILAGPWEQGEIEKEVQSFSNVFYIGRLESEALKGYYHAADILLLIYRANEFSDQLSNSHKMMEYLASGKMIVATHTQEYKPLVEEGLFLMSSSNEEFPILFQSAVNDLDYWNGIEKQKARQNFALQNTYDKQIDRIESIISNLHEGPVR